MGIRVRTGREGWGADDEGGAEASIGMTYELALELKNAGFPLNPMEPVRSIAPMLEGGKAGEYVTLPTLSELIEACGQEIPSERPEYESPGYFSITHYPDSWKAGYLFSAAYEGEGYDIRFEGTGETPEIAVARLYLSLNKKV